MHNHPFTLNEYVTLEMINDQRKRDQERYGNRAGMPWDAYLEPFIRQYGFRPTKNQLDTFIKNMNRNPAYYHERGACDHSGQLNESDWAQFERDMNAQGYFNPYYQ